MVEWIPITIPKRKAVQESASAAPSITPIMDPLLIPPKEINTIRGASKSITPANMFDPASSNPRLLKIPEKRPNMPNKNKAPTEKLPTRFPVACNTSIMENPTESTINPSQSFEYPISNSNFLTPCLEHTQ